MGSPVSRGYASLLLNDPIASPWVLFGHLQQLQPRGGSWWYLLYSPFYSIYIFARTASWRSPIKEISAFSDSHNRRTTSNFPLNMEISVKEATLVAIIIESILYGWYLHRARFLHHWSSFSQGISSFLFAVTLWSLTYQRNPAEVARSMLVAACLLFILSTMVRSLVRSTTTPLSFHSQHVIVDANHVWQGFISSGNPDQFFEDISKDTFKNALYELETLVGDAILVSSVRFPCLTRTQLDRTRSTDAMLYGSELSYSSFPS